MRGGDPAVPNAHRVPEAAKLGTHNEANESPADPKSWTRWSFCSSPWPNRLLSYLPFLCTTTSAESSWTWDPTRRTRSSSSSSVARDFVLPDTRSSQVWLGLLSADQVQVTSRVISRVAISFSKVLSGRPWLQTRAAMALLLLGDAKG
jgi:hypothetical protein